MVVVRAVRAWALSVLACLATLVLWVFAMSVLSGRTDHMRHNMLDLSVAFGGVFAVIAAIVYVPVFTLVTAIRQQPLANRTAMALGAALAPTVFLAIAWTFRESEDPQTLRSWLAYWGSRIPMVVLGSAPYSWRRCLFRMAVDTRRSGDQPIRR